MIWSPAPGVANGLKFRCLNRSSSSNRTAAKIRQLSQFCPSVCVCTLCLTRGNEQACAPRRMDQSLQFAIFARCC
jgi:hypothetical protein